MTDDEAIALGRRAVACKGWRWMPGSRVRADGRAVTGRVLADDENYTGGTQPADLRGEVPDLDDPATLGCLLALVREAWADPFWTTYRVAGKWDAHGYGGGTLTAYAIERGMGFATEAEALVWALGRAAEILGEGEPEGACRRA
jgi:hypothetical protein